ncbi:MAG TPA: hypothetical protein VIL38_03220, partial [Thermaerobacter sp.]
VALLLEFGLGSLWLAAAGQAAGAWLGGGAPPGSDGAGPPVAQGAGGLPEAAWAGDLLTGAGLSWTTALFAVMAGTAAPALLAARARRRAGRPSRQP